MGLLDLNCLINHPELTTDELQVSVNSSPIGGFRGQAGTIQITHRNGKKFQEWSSQNLTRLASLYNQILRIQEQQGVINTLVFGKQEGELFSLNFVPYPHCNLKEKYQALLHIIFGSPPLSNSQIKIIQQFYQDQFSLSCSSLQSPLIHSNTREKEKHTTQKTDPFCKEEVIKRQTILAYSNYEKRGRNYAVLHDNIPKGVSEDDPHFLIVPEKETGHVDGSSVPEAQRLDMLQLSQKVMHVISANYKTILYLERNGSQLRGVQHQHIHLMGIHSFPHTRLQKILAVIRQVFVLWLPFLAKLSSRALQEKIKYYQPTLLNLSLSRL